MSILEYVPAGFTLWHNQVKTLLEVEAAWNAHQIIIIQSPVGSGKSLMAMTISNWRSSLGEDTANVLHRVALQDQYEDTFPDVPVLRGKGRYTCHQGGTCHDEYSAVGEYCSGCPYQSSLNAVTESDVALFNYQSYIYNRLFKHNLILDEGHVTAGIVGDMFSLTLWQAKHKYPKNMNTHGQVAVWLEQELKRINRDLDELVKFAEENKDEEYKDEIASLKASRSTYSRVLGGLQKAPIDFFIEKIEGEYHNKKTAGLRVRPVTLAELPPALWPSKTKKIVIMSATFVDQDLSLLGLKDRSIKFLESDSPIPVGNRRIIVDNPYNMGYKYQENNIPKMVKHLNKIFERHPDKKGMVHIPYSWRETLKDLMPSSRIMWHDSQNKEEVLKDFKASKDPVIMMASGFQEGVDLRGEEFGFQVITKIMWPSKQDQLNEMLYREDVGRMVWETCRSVIQMAGRICRGPDDHGITYIADGAFGNARKKRRGLYQQGAKYFPKYFTESLEWR